MTQDIHYRQSKYGKIYIAGKKKKRIVIGGDPHSGKSTFMRLLEQELKSRKIDVELFELDAAAGDVARFKTGERMEKVPWTMDLAKKTHQNFIKESRYNDLTLGDTPGKVTPITRQVTKGADGAIILAKDETAKRRWSSFFGHQKIPVISIVDTKMVNDVNYFNPMTNRGLISHLDRDKLMEGKITHNNVVIEGVAFEISQYFGYTLKQRRRL